MSIDKRLDSRYKWQISKNSRYNKYNNVPSSPETIWVRIKKLTIKSKTVLPIILFTS